MQVLKEKVLIDEERFTLERYLLCLLLSMRMFSVINIEKLYMIRLANISCITQSFFFE